MNEHRRHVGIGFWFVVVVTVFVTYVLSLGPAVWLIVHLPSDPTPWFEALEVVYYPLELLLPNSGPVNDLLNAYVELWLDFDVPSR